MAVAQTKIEIRLNDDGSLDEVVAGNAWFHLEQLNDNLWWMAITKGGETVHVKLFARGKIKASFHREPTG